MYDFQFQTVSRIISGLGSIQELTTVLTEQSSKKVLLVTDNGMLQQQLHHPILEILEHLSLAHVIYADVIADPPEHVVYGDWLWWRQLFRCCKTHCNFSPSRPVAKIS